MWGGVSLRPLRDRTYLGVLGLRLQCFQLQGTGFPSLVGGLRTRMLCRQTEIKKKKKKKKSLRKSRSREGWKTELHPVPRTSTHPSLTGPQVCGVPEGSEEQSCGSVAQWRARL